MFRLETPWSATICILLIKATICVAKICILTQKQIKGCKYGDSEIYVDVLADHVLYIYLPDFTNAPGAANCGWLDRVASVSRVDADVGILIFMMLSGMPRCVQAHIPVVTIRNRNKSLILGLYTSPRNGFHSIHMPNLRCKFLLAMPHKHKGKLRCPSSY